MSWTRYVQDRIESTLSVLKPIPKAIQDLYNTQRVRDFRQGFTQLFSVPSFLRRSFQTTQLMQSSLNLNIVRYVIPAVLYRRGVNLLLAQSPDWFDPAIMGLDGFIMLIFMTRLFIRRTRDNLFISLSLTRTITNDNQEYMPVALAKDLAQALTECFSKMFSHNQLNNDVAQNKLQLELTKLFKTFFLKKNIGHESFSILENPLLELFCKILTEDGYYFENESSEEFYKLFAKMIHQVLADAFKEQNEEILQSEQKQLARLLSKEFIAARSSELAAEFLQKLKTVRDRLKPFFPLDQTQPCDCLFYKKIQGNVGSLVYGFGNTIFTYTPEVINAVFVMQPQTFFLMRTAFSMLRFLYKGQSFNEFKVSGCTRHRSQTLAANRPHSLGLAAAFTMVNELFSELISYIANDQGLYCPNLFDHILRKDAVMNLTSQWTTISALGFSERLPRGREHQHWDFFYGARLETMAMIKYTQWLFLPNKKGPKEALFKKVKDMIESPYLHTLGEWLLQGYDLYPKKLVELMRHKKVELNALRMIFACDQVKTFLTLYSEDINSPLPVINYIQSHPKWIGGVLFISKPMAFISFLAILPLLILKDQSFEKFMASLKDELRLLSKAMQVTVVEEKDYVATVSQVTDEITGKLVIVLNEDFEQEEKVDLSESKKDLDDEFFLIPAELESSDDPPATAYFYYGDGIRNTVWNKGRQRASSLHQSQQQGQAFTEGVKLKSFT